MEQINQYLPLVIAVGVIVVIALMIVDRRWGAQAFQKHHKQ